MASTSEANRFEVAIVGAGPAGLAAGAQAARRGLSHVVLDSARPAYTIFRYQKGKHVMAEPSDLPLRKEVGFDFAASSRETVLEAFELATRNAHTNVWAGTTNSVTRIEGAAGDFVLTLADGRKLSCGKLVLATGAGDVRTFQVPGAELPYVTYQLDDPDNYVNKTIAVIGAGDAGIENALALALRDNDVSIVNRGQDFTRAKPQNGSDITSAVANGTITHYPNCEVERFEDGAALLSGGLRLEVDLVIGRLGATPSRTLLSMVGVKFPDDPNGVPEISPKYESNVPGVYLIGALAGYPLIKQCLNQGYEVIENICGNDVRPADEPLLQKIFAVVPEHRTVDEHLRWIKSQLPLLQPLSTLQLRQFVAGSEIVVPHTGDVIFTRNDYTNDFYLILSGTVAFRDASLDADVDANLHRGSSQDPPLIAGVGEFFGEVGLLSGRRRSATVTAGTDCILIKTPRKLMTTVMKDVAGIKQQIDRMFIVRRIRDLAGHDATSQEIEDLANAAVVEHFAQGHEIWRQGDESNGLHLIRSGSVMVSVTAQGNEAVVGYLPAGNIVGEGTMFSPDAKRKGTVRATVATETIRIPRAPLIDFLGRHPALKGRLEGLQSDRLIENVRLTSENKSGDIVDFLRRVGAGEATNLLLIDESLCVRCDNCEKACKATHGGVSRLDRAAGPTFASVHIPTSCRHCENAKCMTDCPPDALVRRTTGEIHILQDKCIGCGNCAANCPYHVIQMAPVEHARPSLLDRLLFWRPEEPDTGHETKAVKCDLCVELPGIAAGSHHTACVSACPTGAIIRTNPKAYVEELMHRAGD